jgi:hypothetical protein
MNFGTTRLRGKPRNRYQDEVREDGWIVGGEGWQEKVHNREEWKKLLRTAMNHCILHRPNEWMNMQCVHSFIHLFIFRRSFTRYGNSHLYKNTKIKTNKQRATYRIYKYIIYVLITQYYS